MRKAFSSLNETDLRNAWKWTVTICLGYMVVLTVFIGLIFYNLAVSVSHDDQARLGGPGQPTVRSDPTQLAATGKLK